MSLPIDPCRINADLHCHSCFSDGVLSPADIVARAHANEVQVLALTDHDELGGLSQAQQVARDLSIEFVPGVEISVTWAGKTIHIVGLRIDPENAALASGLKALRDGRNARARQMGAELARLAGIQGAYEGALERVSNPSLISRTHFARFLVDTGVCESTNQVFRDYLVEGKPGFVAHQWASLSQAVGWIVGAGGQAVIAHPGRYRLDDTALWALMHEFREAGGVSIEVITGSHTRDQYRQFANVAREFDFAASRGSDFHSPHESRVDLGDLPLLPDSVLPLWHDWNLS